MIRTKAYGEFASSPSSSGVVSPARRSRRNDRHERRSFKRRAAVRCEVGTTRALADAKLSHTRGHELLHEPLGERFVDGKMQRTLRLLIAGEVLSEGWKH